MSCPPASAPSRTIGWRLARAVYRAAVSPAGPEPTISTGALVRDVAIRVRAPPRTSAISGAMFSNGLSHMTIPGPAGEGRGPTRAGGHVAGVVLVRLVHDGRPDELGADLCEPSQGRDSADVLELRRSDLHPVHGDDRGRAEVPELCEAVRPGQGQPGAAAAWPGVRGRGGGGGPWRGAAGGGAVRRAAAGARSRVRGRRDRALGGAPPDPHLARAGGRGRGPGRPGRPGPGAGRQPVRDQAPL